MSDSLRIVSLGGSGGFGLNATLVVWRGEALLVDFGAGYPHAGMLGVERLVPDPRPLLDEVGRLHAVLLTHAHDDHCGAIGHLPPPWRSAPVYGLPLTLRVARDRCLEAGRSLAAAAVPEEGELAIGPFRARFVPVAHSVPQSSMLVIDTPAGRLVHSGDFKFDDDPVSGSPTDRDRLRRLGREGVRVLLLDSTGARTPGRTAGERLARRKVADAVRGVEGQVLATTFSSHVDRISAFLAAAAAEGRTVGLVGRRMTEMARHALELGLLDPPSGLLASPEEVAELPPRRRLWLAGGCQGELGSSMTRISFGNDRLVRTGPGDRVLISARVIPGAEPLVSRMIDRFLRTGAEVWHADDHPGLHVSGHAAREELREMVELLAPEFVVPVHGDRRHLEMNAAIAASASAKAVVAESGEWLALGGEGMVRGASVDLPPRLFDASGREATADEVRRRRRIARHGIVIVVLEGEEGVRVDAHGIAGWDDDPDLRREILTRAREIAAGRRGEGRPPGALAEELARTLGNLLRGEARFRPEVIVSEPPREEER